MSEVMEKVSDIKNKFMCFLKKEKDAFKKMSKAEKRVAIAEDVIAQIRCETYVPTSGTYVEINASSKAADKGFDVYSMNTKPADLMMQEGMLSCNVCAKGAMFLSHVRKDVDSCTIDQARRGADERHIEHELTDLFSEEQLDMIEAAFEGQADFYTDNHGEDTDDDGDVLPTDPGMKAERFAERYSDDQKRLIGIMRNIIKNKGTFKP